MFLENFFILNNLMSKVGISYSPSHVLHQCYSEEINHVENPKRALEMYEEIEKSGLLSELTFIEFEPANDETLLLIHSPSHLDTMKSLNLKEN
jgi:acetoin utilization deacetylase AcuC-like enzyme